MNKYNEEIENEEIENEELEEELEEENIGSIRMNDKTEPKVKTINKKAIIFIVGIITIVAVFFILKPKNEVKKVVEEKVNEQALEEDTNIFDSSELLKETIEIKEGEMRLPSGNILLEDGEEITPYEYTKRFGNGNKEEQTEYEARNTDYSSEYSSEYSDGESEREELKRQVEIARAERRKLVAEKQAQDNEKALQSDISFSKKQGNAEKTMEEMIADYKKQNGGQMPNYEELLKIQNANQLDPFQMANNQKGKKEFSNTKGASSWYNKSSLSDAISQYEVKGGSILPTTLITAINTDLPSYTTAIIRENIYDTQTGRILLIPMGTKVIGQYDSVISFGQTRVMIIFQRIILPNGKSIDLENFGGVDLRGQGGITGEVSNHFGKLFQGVLLSAMLGGASQSIPNTNDIIGGAIKEGTETTVSIGEKFADKVLNIQPTIKIKEGERFNIFVHKDLVLEPYSD